MNIGVWRYLIAAGYKRPFALARDVVAGGDSCAFIPERFAALHMSRSVMSVSFAFGSGWTCRLFVLDGKGVIRSSFGGLGEEFEETLRAAVAKAGR